MTTTELTQARQALPSRDVQSFRRALGGRRGLIAAGAAIAAAGLAFNWSWLVAAGIAPVLLGLLPCAAMCALGLCMNRMTSGSCSAENVAREDGADSPKTPSADMKGNG
ncbi:conserved hypothetical protein [Mesorhizobium metallidurans STM 2683]|uniref:Transmembrane protein n=1 Tax=Mesorhizobium metallidurans STM 2683 TaxID=1297569 RepID=M5ETS7_9HYPH|nr:hypothetical protein [Mesorhizobium metallidurans]CCV08364.1 conserved hypothetical protein [Mesorhizobium metallidurans STM 2683]